MSWKNDVGFGNAFNLVNKAAGKASMAKGDKLRFRNIDVWAGSSGGAPTIMKITDHAAKLSGKLLDSITQELAESQQSSKFFNMFSGSNSLVDASGFDLSGVSLSENCFNSMFQSCTSLTAAPQLPATTLAVNCYNAMFRNCTSLTAAPQLPATTLADGCYESMFYVCPSLTQAPALPATTLADSCYNGMFGDCTSLTQAPALPATTLAGYCYGGMFSGCTSLTQAPALPATTLAFSCYGGMFSGCTSLTQAPALPATTLAGNCYNSMFSVCTNIAELHYPASVQNDSTFTGMSGSPWFGATNATVHYDL